MLECPYCRKRYKITSENAIRCSCGALAYWKYNPDTRDSWFWYGPTTETATQEEIARESTPEATEKRDISNALYDLYVYIDASRDAWREDNLDNALHWIEEAHKTAQTTEYQLNLIRARRLIKQATTKPAS